MNRRCNNYKMAEKWPQKFKSQNMKGSDQLQEMRKVAE